MKNNKPKALSLIPAMFLFAALIGNSAYLSYKYSQFYYAGDFSAFINCADDCDSVMMSEYALLFGVPVPFYGLGFFLTLLVTFLLLLYSKNKTIRFLFEFMLISGCIAATIFLYILYFKLEMFCKFCTLSHICTGLLTAHYFFFLKK